LAVAVQNRQGMSQFDPQLRVIQQGESGSLAEVQE